MIEKDARKESNKFSKPNLWQNGVKRMKITTIKIRNFGPFYKEHKVEFPKDGSGVHLIRGCTGQGKTSLQRAILWGLFGKVLDRNGREIPATSLLNRTAAKENEDSFSVHIFFNHENSTWSVSRIAEVRNAKNGTHRIAERFDVVKDGEVQSNPQHAIERILPYDVSRFFFFDGEMLRDYEELLDQDSHSMKVLRESIEHILGIPYLRTARDDLDQVMRETEKEQARLIRRLGGKAYDQLASDFQTICAKIERAEKSTKELDKQIDDLERQIGEKKRRLTDIKSVQTLATQRIDLEGQIRKLEDDARNAKLELQELNSKLYKIIVAPIARNLVKQLEMKHNESMSKYDRKQHLKAKVQTLEKTLQMKECEVCGARVDQKNAKRLQAEIADAKNAIERLTQIPEPNLEFEKCKNVLDKIVAIPASREEYNPIKKVLEDTSYKIASVNQRLNDVKRKLGDVDEEEPSRIENEIREYSKEQGRLEGDKKRLQDQLVEDYGEKSDLEQRMARIDKHEINILAKRIQICRSVSGIFEKAISAYREDRRTEVEKEATRVFRKIRSKESFSSLVINDNFGLSILTEDGTILDRAEWRSAGEEQIVALALIGALNKCSKTVAPVFMDAPFARLDTNHVQRVVQYVPSMSEQVVMLVTDREFTKNEEELLKGRIKTDLTVEHRGEHEGSQFAKTYGGGKLR
jgi:DNA sulfur modification protein DndD